MYDKNIIVEHLNSVRNKNQPKIKINAVFISSSANKHYRLTKFGYTLMEKEFEKFEVSLYNISNKNSDIVSVDKYITTPFYFKKGILVIFEEFLATELFLLSGDFSLWVNNKKFWEDT